MEWNVAKKILTGAIIDEKRAVAKVATANVHLNFYVNTKL